MFTLNPLSTPDAWWQHATMILVAAVIGFIIGNKRNSEIVVELENKLTKLDQELSYEASKGKDSARIPPKGHE